MKYSEDDIKKVIRLALIEQRVKNILARRTKMAERDSEISWEKDKNSGKNPD